MKTASDPNEGALCFWTFFSICNSTSKYHLMNFLSKPITFWRSTLSPTEFHGNGCFLQLSLVFFFFPGGLNFIAVYERKHYNQTFLTAIDLCPKTNCLEKKKLKTCKIYMTVMKNQLLLPRFSVMRMISGLQKNKESVTVILFFVSFFF